MWISLIPASLRLIMPSTAYSPHPILRERELIPWTNIAVSIASSAYTTDWQVIFSSLQAGVNYVSVRSFNVAGGSATLTDAFYIKKDTQAPAYVNYESGGDSVWQKNSSRAYNVDWTDTGGSQLNTFEYFVSTGANMSGTQVKDWTQVQTSIASNSYTTDFNIDFNSLIENATNYVSLRMYDAAQNSTTIIDAFFRAERHGGAGRDQ